MALNFLFYVIFLPVDCLYHVLPPAPDTYSHLSNATKQVRFVCHSQRGVKRVVALPKASVTLVALQEEVRKKLATGSEVGIHISYPLADGYWQMLPLATQEDLDAVVVAKISDLYISLWA